MSKAEEEEQARLERARAIGLFRYMLIREAADPALTARQRGKLVRAIAAREHADPSGRPVRLTRWTLDRWIRMWQQGGFDALVPAPRQSQPRTRPRSGGGRRRGRMRSGPGTRCTRSGWVAARPTCSRSSTITPAR